MDAREEAMEALNEALIPCLDKDGQHVERPLKSWFGLGSDVGALLLETLTSPRTVECETCDGRGWVMSEADQGEGWETVKSPCEPCSGSGRIEKGPIAYLASELTPILALNDDGAGGTFADENGTQRSYSRPQTSRVVGYRLPGESPKGGA